MEFSVLFLMFGVPAIILFCLVVGILWKLFKRL